MVNYTCEKCNKEFTKKCHYLTHLNKKKPCGTINDFNINDTDVWLYGLDSNGNENYLWSQVPSITGNNIIYNSLDKTIRNIYQVQTRANDSISLLLLIYSTFKIYIYIVA